MPTKAHAVFWDMDGTLIDTEDLHFEVIRDWCAEYGYTLTEEGNKELIAKTMPEKWSILASRLNDEASEEKFRRDCEDWYIERLTADKGLERSIKIVHEVAKRGIVQACVSNGEHNVVKANVEILGLTDIFSFLVTGGNCDPGKPAPDPYLMAAKQAGFEPSECIAVEDSVVGMKAARAAGLILCGWPHYEGDYDVDYLLKTGDEFPFELLD
ncbi:HAD family phosphatase [Pseudodesulfovibrio sp. zrk46]|uniref:HAD family hydrolase n=1 Tax=Pseudodesulfovibrio sp. zrk46 TaxID=2725288 RepID=UPI001449B66A|nr:HAD family phosphatase [Pseudodesulfovibrio sp. zrk46]QJB57239.1 HAD family phosphatase [Pseudodesulfovibrio sp. zrk46]